ncbi:protoporphyrinogen oxidase [Planctomicrobium sp. SH664]|uniref:protoporphyrinogen oxidase n=1 Tax=Planctomicrobium sp. SH664 TaxID=3448125 RepID=UPI003F5BC0A7
MSASFANPQHASIRRIAVLGAGITGLAAAQRLIDLSQKSNSPIRVTVFEACSRAGGVFGSERIGDYLIERGADSFITNKPGGVALCRRLGLLDELIPTDATYRQSLILHRGKPVPIPAGFNLLAPTQIWPMLTTPLLSWRGKLRLAAERWVPARQSADDESLAAFVRRRLGAEVLERIVQPLVGGIYTSDPEQLSLRSTLPRFVEMEQKYGSLIRGLRAQAAVSRSTADANGARYDLFMTPRTGMQRLLDALTESIRPHVELRLNSPVDRLTRQQQGWQVTTAGRPAEDFEGVILALPAQTSATVLNDSVPAAAEALRKIDQASSAIVVSGHSLSDFDHPLNAFGLVIPHQERRRILAISFLSRKFPDRAPPGKVILRTFVGGAMQPEEFHRTDAEIIATVQAELQSLFNVRREPEFAVVARYPKAMPQYTLGHQSRVSAIREAVATQLGLQLAGNYFEGVGVPDCISSGEQAAEKLLADLAAMPVVHLHS